MAPGEAYFLLLGATALFVAPFHALARIIVGAWVAGHYLFLAGATEPLANLLQHAAVLVLGIRRLRTPSCLYAWLLGVFLLCADGLWLTGWIAPAEAWWSVLALATAQLACLPFGIDTAQRRATIATWQTTRDIHFLRSMA